MISTQQMVHFLKKQDLNAGLITRLKVAYRPLICPFEDLLEYIQAGDKVFDIGCGSGQFCLLVAEFSKAASISGIEIRSDLLKNATELLKPYEDRFDIKFSQFNGVQIPDTVQEHNRVFLIDVLHHVPAKQQQGFLKHIYDKMQTGAHLILKDIDAASPLVVFNKLHDLVLASEIGHEVSLKQIRKQLTEFGFEVVREQQRQMYWYPHYTLVLEKT